jgi:hypothetical protein
MSQRNPNIEVINHDIELDEQLPLQEKGWAVQKVGLAVIFTIMFAGLIGVFGSGWVSKRHPSIGNVKANYEGFFRYETEMKILVESGMHVSSIALPQHYIKEFRTLRFEPEPFNNHTEEGEVVFNFLPDNNRIITLYLIPKTYGSVKGALKINQEYSLPLRHFIFP